MDNFKDGQAKLRHAKIDGHFAKKPSVSSISLYGISGNLTPALCTDPCTSSIVPTTAHRCCRCCLPRKTPALAGHLGAFTRAFIREIKRGLVSQVPYHKWLQIRAGASGPNRHRSKTCIPNLGLAFPAFGQGFRDRKIMVAPRLVDDFLGSSLFFRLWK